MERLVIPTDERTGLFKLNDKLQYSIIQKKRDGNDGYHIYITNSDEIKIGDYYLCRLSMKLLKCIGDEYFNNIDEEKIILTDNTKLIKDGVQAIDDEFLEWFVNNPSYEEVDILPLRKSSGYYDEKDVWHWDFLAYKIIIPIEEPKQRPEKYSERFNKGLSPDESMATWGKRTVEEPKQETIEEATEKYKNYYEVNAFNDGVKWQINKQDEFTLGFLHWYNTSQDCETYLRRNYPKNITMNGEHYKKVLEINKELLEMYKNTLPR